MRIWPSTRSLLALCGLAALVGPACAGTGPNACRIQVVALEKREVIGDGVDLGYRVKGYAGGPGKTWLAAKQLSGGYVSGTGVEVGPGPFVAVVEIELNRDAPGYVAVLEIPGKRCSAGI